MPHSVVLPPYSGQRKARKTPFVLSSGRAKRGRVSKDIKRRACGRMPFDTTHRFTVGLLRANGVFMQDPAGSAQDSSIT